MVVVFPPPLIPMTRTTSGFSWLNFCLSPLSTRPVIISLRAPVTLAGSVILLFFMFFRSSSMMVMVVSIPMSEVMSISSSSSIKSSSTLALSMIASLIFSESLPKKDFFSENNDICFPLSKFMAVTTQNHHPASGKGLWKYPAQAWSRRTARPHVPWSLSGE